MESSDLQRKGHAVILGGKPEGRPQGTKKLLAASPPPPTPKKVPLRHRRTCRHPKTVRGAR